MDQCLQAIESACADRSVRAGQRRDVADWFESLSLDAPALFPVSWAGEQASAGWFDIGREFTELWHHQQQIRMAVGADALVRFEISGRGDRCGRARVAARVSRRLGRARANGSDRHQRPGGGQWTLARETERWTLSRGEPSVATARIRLDDDTAWKLLFNALSEDDAARAVRVEGPPQLAAALLRARSVVV